MKVGGTLLTLQQGSAGPFHPRTTGMALGSRRGDLGSVLVRDGKSGDRSLIRKVGAHVSPAVENFMLRNFLTGVMRGTKKNGRHPRNDVNLEIKN